MPINDQDQLEKHLVWAVLENNKRFQSMTAEEIYNSLGQNIQ